MKKIFILLLIFFPLLNIFTDINTYQQIKIHTIEIGSENGQIGYDPRRPLMGGAPAGPTTFTISFDNKFYICDTINFKINVYDSNFSYLQYIANIEYGVIHAAFSLKVNNDNNILVLDGSTNLIKFNSEGEMEYFIWKDQLSNAVKSKNDFFAFNDKVLYYGNGDIVFLDESGKKIDQEIVENELSKIQQSVLTRSNTETLPVKTTEIGEFIQNNKIVLDKNNLLTSDFSKHREYYKTIAESKARNKSVSFGDKIDLSKLSIGLHRLIGFDSEGNSYWDVITGRKPDDRAVLVCSQYGEALDCFHNRIKWSSVSVAPAGDVYFMDYDATGTHIYKVTRRW